MKQIKQSKPKAEQAPSKVRFVLPSNPMHSMRGERVSTKYAATFAVLNLAARAGTPDYSTLTERELVCDGAC